MAKKKSKRKAGTIPQTYKFNGKEFKIVQTCNTKTSATAKKKALRADGWNARSIVITGLRSRTGGKVHAVYKRRPAK